MEPVVTATVAEAAWSAGGQSEHSALFSALAAKARADLALAAAGDALCKRGEAMSKSRTTTLSGGGGERGARELLFVLAAARRSRAQPWAAARRRMRRWRMHGRRWWMRQQLPGLRCVGCISWRRYMRYTHFSGRDGVPAAAIRRPRQQWAATLKPQSRRTFCRLKQCFAVTRAFLWKIIS